MEPEYKPQFSVGDRVVSVYNGHPLDCIVIAVQKPGELQEFMKRHNLDESQFFLAMRDRDYQKNYTYVVRPYIDKSPPSYSESKMIVPTLTKDQYDLLFAQHRRYSLLESDLVDFNEYHRVKR